MKTLTLSLIVLLLAAVVPTRPANGQTEPVASGRLLHAEFIHLDTSFKYEWRAEHPEITTGWLLVIEADRELLKPRQTTERVFYAGRQVAMRFNVGMDSGRLVLFVPATLDKQGRPVEALDSMRFYFGGAELPERVDARHIAVETQRAIAAGIQSRPSTEVEALLARDNATRTLANRSELDRAAARLIQRWVPEEAELAHFMLGPPPEKAVQMP